MERLERLAGLGVLGVVSLTTIICATILSLNGVADVAAWLTLAGTGIGGVAGFLTGQAVANGRTPIR